MVKYVYDRFRERDSRVKYNLVFNSRINFAKNMHLCNYCTKIFVIVVNTCVYRRSVDNKALIYLSILSAPAPGNLPSMTKKKANSWGLARGGGGWAQVELTDA